MRLHTLVLGRLKTNCYIAADERTGEAAVIDPACDGERILAFLTQNGYTLKCIFLTHGHFDHVGAVDYLRRETGTLCYVHEDEGTDLANCVSVKDGVAVEFGECKAVTLHTPGHTSGSVCYYVSVKDKGQRAEGVLLSGDTLFAGTVGRCDFPTGDYDAMLSSVDRLVREIPGETPVYPGHGPATTMLYEREHNPYIRRV